MSGRTSQRKGRNAELELCEYLRQRGFDAVPGKAQSYGKTPDIYGLDGLHFEVKRCEQLRIPAWLIQAERDAQRFNDGLPVVTFRRNREPWNVAMRLSDFLTLYKDRGEHRDAGRKGSAD